MEKFIFKLPKRETSIFEGLKDFRLIHCIGKGGFSQVYLAEHINTTSWYAIKKMDFRNLCNLD